MKLALCVLAMAFTMTLNAQAADRKIGNMIAVERSIDNVFQTCVAQLDTNDNESELYSCKYDIAKTALDFTAGSQTLLNVSDENCSVEASVQKAKILVLFSAQTGKRDQAAAKACLQKALNGSQNKDTFKFYAYTLE